MSLLSDYERRTCWKYEPIRGAFHTHEGLTRKVAPDGSFRPFPGTTVVFRAGRMCLKGVGLMQRALYALLEGTGMLSSPLPEATTHMTLHDLVSPEACEADPADRERYDSETADSLNRAAAAVEEIRRTYAGQRVVMKADRIVSMMSKSLVLMLKPASEGDMELLLELYGRFDGIRRLAYPLTPHITLAYFRPGPLDGDRLGEAVDRVQIRPENAPEFTFYPEALTAQAFLDMRTYGDVPERLCLCCDGGLNRSVLAANILNRLAEERGLPVRAEARSAFRNTQGRAVPRQVWDVLEKHGIRPDLSYASARYLEDHELSWFTGFAAMTAGAADRIAWLELPGERTEASGWFFGVRDPEYGEISYEDAFGELYRRAERYLDAFRNRHG